MNRTDARLRMSSAPDMTTAGNVPVTGLRRLAVVLFEVDEEALLARQIRDVVKVRELSVLLIGVAPDPAGEAQLRRKLARIAAFRVRRSPFRCFTRFVFHEDAIPLFSTIANRSFIGTPSFLVVLPSAG